MARGEALGAIVLGMTNVPEMGIGGGWCEHEWRAYGYAFPSAGVRLANVNAIIGTSAAST
ncbi:hypothetical protein [Mycolicibacterium sarraceniae]|uniref:Uncharacterized protein n=1 Tax=Mycolicibacterium sarraceniae TaxID=1534348 RepID=A0A7I7SNZ4_9MYCO|nr:hypothetical protein [Mycolicibacterium sarraceniae]BBY57755.1 hypothetical protein MSAR_08910 [Mycolicibacterium sarraceniae]